MSRAQLHPRNMRYITAMAFRINPMSSSKATASLRLLLADQPFSLPKGATGFPETKLSSVDNVQDQGIDVTYSDKSTVTYKVQEGLTARDLIRQIEEPAKRLRAKEDGI